MNRSTFGPAMPPHPALSPEGERGRRWLVRFRGTMREFGVRGSLPSEGPRGEGTGLSFRFGVHALAWVPPVFLTYRRQGGLYPQRRLVTFREFHLLPRFNAHRAF